VLRGVSGEPTQVDRLSPSGNYYTLVSSGATTVEWASIQNADLDGLQLSGSAGCPSGRARSTAWGWRRARRAATSPRGPGERGDVHQRDLRLVAEHVGSGGGVQREGGRGGRGVGLDF